MIFTRTTKSAGAGAYTPLQRGLDGNDGTMDGKPWCRPRGLDGITAGKRNVLHPYFLEDGKVLGRKEATRLPRLCEAAQDHAHEQVQRHHRHKDRERVQEWVGRNLPAAIQGDAARRVVDPREATHVRVEGRRLYAALLLQRQVVHEAVPVLARREAEEGQEGHPERSKVRVCVQGAVVLNVAAKKAKKKKRILRSACDAQFRVSDALCR